MVRQDRQALPQDITQVLDHAKKQKWVTRNKSRDVAKIEVRNEEIPEILADDLVEPLFAALPAHVRIVDGHSSRHGPTRVRITQPALAGRQHRRSLLFSHRAQSTCKAHQIGQIQAGAAHPVGRRHL